MKASNRSEVSSLLSYKSMNRSDNVSIDSFDTIEELNLENSVFPSRGWPCLIYFASLLFAGFAGHIITFAYMQPDALNNSITKKSVKKIASAQDYAQEQLQNQLQTLSDISEEYHANENIKQNKIMTSNVSGNETIPPLPPQDGCDATIMIFRHCEAGVAREHCGYMGNLRSDFIATLFGNSTNERWPMPSFIFAMSTGERHKSIVHNWREIETVIPLSKKANVTVDQTYGFPEKEEFTQHLFSLVRSGEMCGKLAVISWKHHDMPHFAHSLGCGPDDGCPMDFGEDEYDAAWQIKYSYHTEKNAPYIVEDTSPKALKKHKKHPWGTAPKWWVYGSVQQEGFDPLAFAKADGSY